MGCDIHLHIEALLDGEWQHVGEAAIGRSYELFSAMVEDHPRNGGRTGIAPERGVPEDANPYTKHIMANVDYHTHSWLSQEEMFAIPELSNNQDIEFALYEALPLRLVFAFDN